MTNADERPASAYDDPLLVAMRHARVDTYQLAGMSGLPRVDLGVFANVVRGYLHRRGFEIVKASIPETAT